MAKKEKEMDEGFLARMMRPTQASASKEKAPITPPRRYAAAPVKQQPAREHHKIVKNEPELRTEPVVVKRIVPLKAAESGPPPATESPAAKHSVPVIGNGSTTERSAESESETEHDGEPVSEHGRYDLEAVPESSSLSDVTFVNGDHGKHLPDDEFLDETYSHDKERIVLNGVDEG